MTEEQKQALIEHIETCLGCLKNVALKYSDECEHEWILRDIQVQEIALAALTAQPDDWKQRAEAAEAKLAELEKQEPVGHFMLARDEDDSWWYEASEQNDKAIPLFTRAAPAAHRVPEGWKLVPVEPTEEMIAAGDQFMDGLSRLGDAYDAMLAAAPGGEP